MEYIDKKNRDNTLLPHLDFYKNLNSFRHGFHLLKAIFFDEGVPAFLNSTLSLVDGVFSGSM